MHCRRYGCYRGILDPKPQRVHDLLVRAQRASYFQHCHPSPDLHQAEAWGWSRSERYSTPDILDCGQGLDDEVPASEVEGASLLGLLVERRELGGPAQGCKHREAGGTSTLNLHRMEEGVWAVGPQLWRGHCICCIIDRTAQTCNSAKRCTVQVGKST